MCLISYDKWVIYKGFWGKEKVRLLIIIYIVFTVQYAIWCGWQKDLDSGGMMMESINEGWEMIIRQGNSAPKCTHTCVQLFYL